MNDVDDFFHNAEVVKSVKIGEPGTKKILNQTEFKGRLVRIRYYRNKKTGENKKTYEIDIDTSE